MNGVAKQIRWSHFLDRRSGRGIIVPIDHGLSIGPVEGLASVEQVSRWIGHSGITGIIAHKGMVERLGSHGLLKGLGVMVHLNGMMSLASMPDRKERLTSVEAALRLGADAVSVQLNFDGTNDAHNLTQLGAVVDEAQRYGMPVLTMLYDKVACDGQERRLSRLRHLMRACVELGTDALKLAAPDDLSLMPTLLDGIREHTAVFFAGGAVRSEEEILMMAQEVVSCGATGLCVGRNIFQRESARATLTRLQEVVLGSHDPVLEPTVSWSLPIRSQVRWSSVAEEVVK
ncbi:class I fructose-bisphosphate aldolase [Archangium lipolyticum]|uniref:class I fructose-bisphosphate aldolase n=1 Tax=Archangium lipolyticum TaxID=2970465 RepID=UPI00214A2B72|nr:aldolase [Archangium lipolyticum]